MNNFRKHTSNNFLKAISWSLRFTRGIFYVVWMTVAISIPFRLARDYMFMMKISEYIDPGNSDVRNQLITKLISPYGSSFILLITSFILAFLASISHEKIMGYKPENTKEIKATLKSLIVIYFIIYALSLLSNNATIVQLEMQRNFFNLP